MQYKKEAGYEIREFLRVARKRLWLLITVFVLVVSGTTVVAYRMTPIYQATALLQIEKKEPSVVGIQDVYQVDVRPDDFYQTQYRLITSMRVCKNVFDRLDLDRSERYAEKQDAVALFVQDIMVEPVRDTYLVKVSYESEDAELAAKVANSVSDEYVSNVRREKKTVSDEAENKIIEQIPVLRKQLHESQNALRKFEEENSALSFDKIRAIVYESLSSVNAKITKVKQDIATAKAECDSVVNAKTPDDLLSLPVVVVNQAIQLHNDKLLEFEAERAGLLEEFKEGTQFIKTLDAKINAARERIREEALKIAESLKKRLNEKTIEIKQLEVVLREQEELAKSIDTKMVRYDTLKAEVEGNRKLYEEFVQRQKELQSASQLDPSTVQIVDRAEVPVIPVRPKKRLYVILAALFSLIGGIGLSLGLEYLNDTLRTHEEVEKYVGVPVLGVIPRVKADGAGDGGLDLLVHQKPRSNVSEAYRSIRTSLTYSLPAGGSRAFVVTSAGPQEGKTTIAINLSIALAHAGKKVLLVDSDLRKPRIHKTFKTDGAKGLTNCLVGQGSIQESIVKTEIENLSIMPSGPIPPNPAELLGSLRMKDLVTQMKNTFDIVVFDSPPLIPVTDGTLLAALSDGTIQVIWAGSTSRKVVEIGKEGIESVGAKVIGVVLNNLAASAGDHYYYHHYRYHPYYEYYGSDEKESSGKETS